MAKHEDTATISGVGSSDVLAATGFEACEFGPETGDRCEKCGVENKQQYFRRTDVFCMDGEYWCLICVRKEHAANQSDFMANANLSEDIKQ